MRRARLIAPLACLLASCGEADAPPAEPGADRAAHFSPASASAQAKPRGRHLTARLTRPAVLRAQPAGRPLVRLRTRTEFGSPQVLAVTRRRGGWLQVVSSELRNGRRGWIRARVARLRATPYSIHVDRSRRTATLKRRNRTIRRLPVAVGRPGNETPLGRFAVTDRLRPHEPTSPYGCCAIALSGHQAKLPPGWPGGDRLAIHGTPQPETVGRAASLGCMRARRRDLEALMSRVPLGTPVFIRR